jgi:uncharacterized peroxidase-related enzyme
MSSEYQLSLSPLTLETAAPRAQAALESAKASLGFIPSMYAVMANSPGLLESYLHGYSLFRQESGFTPVEQEIIFLTLSRENGCHYCVAAHSFVADAMSKVPPAVTDAIRDGVPIPDAKLAELSTFTAILLKTRGRPSRRDVESFLAADYSERQVLEIILAIAVKTLSNYSNHLFHTPVDKVFASRAWED